MFALKLLGSLIVLSAAAGLGLEKSMEYRQRIEALSELRRMFLLLSGEIRSSRTPIPEAFRHMAGRMDGLYREFLNQMAQKLEQMGGESFSALWKETLKEQLGGGVLKLQKEDMELIGSFGDMFGYLDVQMQLSAIRLLQEQLLDRLGMLTGACAGQMRMAKLLGVGGGIFLVILLV